MTIIADTIPVFPRIPSYGFVVNPRYLVKVIQREGGYERRDRKWNRPLLSYTSVPLEAVSAADADSALTFYHAMGGIATGFRFQDFSDYRSAGSDLTVAITALDQPLIQIGLTGTYQLTKQYVAGSITQYRDIVKPIGSTVLIANTLGATSLSSTWTLDEGSGILTPGGGYTGTPGFWGGSFHVYCRFAGDLNLTMNDFGVTDFTMTLQELRYGS